MKNNLLINIVLRSLIVIGLVFGVLTAWLGYEWWHRHLEFTKSQAETAAQSLLLTIRRHDVRQGLTPHTVYEFSDQYSVLCRQLSEQYRIPQIAMIAPDGTIVAHSDPALTGRKIDNPALLEELGWRMTRAVREGGMLHVLLPVVNAADEDLATLDISIPRTRYLQPATAFVLRTSAIFVAAFIVTGIGLSLVLFREVKQPFSTLIALGEHMLQGHFIESSEFAGRNSLFAQLSAVFVKFSRYLQEMTSLTQDIAGGKLDAIDVQKRSRRDPLGTALQDMLKYLRLVAESAQKISEGQVHISIPLRAETDQFGKTLHQMLKYLDNMAAVATAISEGDLRGEIRPLSEQDVLGTAFDHMTHYLNTLAAAAATFASGDLSHDIQPVTEHDTLGNAFQSMARQLRENFEKIRQEVAARTTAQEALQRLNEELEQRVIERTAEITRQKYILDTFMANVPDSIYFKDRESRFIRGNRSVAALFGVDDPTLLTGKSDFDFFSEEQARPKYEQEQEIMRSGQAILDMEEPDVGERWSLTSKMPLRDEHGEIIGTFGISKNITALKQAEAKIRALNEQLQDENLRMSAEMELARRIQTSLLPPMTTELHPDFETAALMLPAEEVGGDYYDMTFDQEGALWFGIGDVTGHGVTPGLIMMMAQTIHTAITTNYSVSAREAVIMVNNVLYKNVHERLRSDHFMTFTALKYLGEGRFQHAGAHLDLLIYRKLDNVCERIETPGVWLNFIPDISHAIKNSEFTLDIGDVLVLYTDGLTEVWNNQEKMLDIQGFMDIVHTHAGEEVGTLRDAIIADVMDWCQGNQKDDVSLVVVRRIR